MRGLRQLLSFAYARIAAIHTRRSICHYGLSATTGSAAINDRSGKTNGMKPFARFLNVDRLGNAQRVFKFDAKIPHRAVHLGVSE